MRRSTYARPRRSGHRWATVALAAAALALAGLLTVQAREASSLTGSSTSGGATAPSAPVLHDVICRTDCLALRRAAIGGTLQVTGRNLSNSARAVFRGGDGRVAIPVRVDSDTSVTVRVPREARSGPIRIRDRFGSATGPSTRIAIVARGTLRAAGPLQLVSAEATPRRAFFFGARHPQLSYVVAGKGNSSDLRIDVLRANGEIVRSFFRSGVPHNSVQSVHWNGRASNGRPAPGGGYAFRVSGLDGEPAHAGRQLRRQSRSNGAGGNPLTFRMLPFAFPVASRVTWGDGLGAGRNHQGQDLMASCGTPIRAARGGKVTYRGVLEGAAGNYLVISGAATPYDFVYMHMLRPPRLSVGDTVRTGQVIGLVGSTGRSSACHLHFEMWSAPGWYKGGSVINPTGLLQRWYRS